MGAGGVGAMSAVIINEELAGSAIVAEMYGTGHLPTIASSLTCTLPLDLARTGADAERGERYERSS